MTGRPGLRRYAPVAWAALVVCWAVTVLVLSLVPNPPVPKSGWFSRDKVQHATAYSVLTFFLAMRLASLPRWRRSRWAWAALGAVLFGALMEVAQGVLTTSRTADVADAAANAVGACLVAWAGHLFGRRYE